MDIKKDFSDKDLRMFRDIFNQIKPNSGEIPSIKGFDVFGFSLPYNGLEGGDHIIYVDFKHRYDLEKRISECIAKGREKTAENLRILNRKAGILLADVSGHGLDDAILVAMLHQAFLMGVIYELQQDGQISTMLFENINTRLYNSSSFSKFISMIYGEIDESGCFRFINAGHPYPYLFNAKKSRLIPCLQGRKSSPPIGTIPSKDDVDYRMNINRVGYKKKYGVEEIRIENKGDMLLLLTDGLIEHESESFFFPKKVEEIIASLKDSSAEIIANKIKETVLKDGLEDDMSLVLIKKIT